MKKRRNFSNLFLPNRKMDLFVFSILVCGIISGSIFLIMMSNADKVIVVEKIKSFFINVSNNSINNGLALRNSLIVNYIFIITIFLLGFSVIGIIINIFLLYIKGFFVGFSISAIFLTYKVKGIVAVLLYTFPTQVINILIVIILTIYSIIFSGYLIRIITSKKYIGNKLLLKRYMVVFMIGIISSFLSSLSEVYLFPKLLKLVISFYV